MSRFTDERNAVETCRFGGRDVLAFGVVAAVSIALAFPAVARVAEENKLDACKAKMVALGKSILGYQTAASFAYPVVSTEPIYGAPCLTATDAEQLTEKIRKKTPKAAAIGPSGYSWLTQLLPYMGEDELFTRVDRNAREFARKPFDIAVRNDAGEHYSMYPIEALQCPAFESKAEIPYASSAPEYKAFVKIVEATAVGKGGVALTNYVAVTATHLDLAVNPDPKTDAELPNGVIVYSAKMKGVAKIPDGKSNTIVVAETREPGYASWMDGTTSWVVAHDPNSKPPVMSKDGKGRWVCKEADGCRHALDVGPAADDAKKGDGKQAYYREKWLGKEPWRFGPSSMHAEHRVNHLFGDGRVASIVGSGPKAISADVYLALVTRNGGEDASYAE